MTNARIASLICATVTLCAGVASADAGSADAICGYFESLRQRDGAYAYPGQDASHLSATYAAVMTHSTFGRAVPHDARSLGGLIVGPLYPVQTDPARQRTRWHAATMHEFRLQQMRILHALGIYSGQFRQEIDGHVGVNSYSTGYEQGGNPILIQQVCALLAKKECGLRPSETSKRNNLDYLKKRERVNGSFNTTPAADGSDGHVVNTAYALEGLRVLGEKTDPRVVGWIRSCQRRDGGFSWSPNPCAGDVSDLWYTWAGVRALVAFGARPSDERGLRAWIVSLWNADGGFAPRPGRRSDPMATFQAVEILRALGWLDGLKTSERRPPVSAADPVRKDWRVWTIQFEAPGSGSVREAVQVAKELKIHLWGAKNADPLWIVEAQKEADRLGVPVTFFRSDESYGVRRDLPGFGNFSHLRDPVTPPPGATDSRTFNLWQICDHECCARVWLDSGDYDAIGTFHFGCFDMTWLLPHLYQYEGVIPFVSNQDSHGETWWWRDELMRYRTVFLAPGGSWDDFRAACRRGTVASVREDRQTDGRLRILGGSASMRKVLLERQEDWRVAKLSETVSVQVLGPDSLFEVARPTSGRVLRVRVDYHWRESGGILDPSCRLARVKRAGTELPIERVVRRHEEQDYLHGIIEEAYDLVRLGDELPQRLELEFEPLPGAHLKPFVKVVDIR